MTKININIALQNLQDLIPCASDPDFASGLKALQIAGQLLRLPVAAGRYDEPGRVDSRTLQLVGDHRGAVKV